MIPEINSVHGEHVAEPLRMAVPVIQRSEQTMKNDEGRTGAVFAEMQAHEEDWWISSLMLQVTGNAFHIRPDAENILRADLPNLSFGIAHAKQLFDESRIS